MKNRRAENTTYLVRLGQAFEDKEHLLSRPRHRLCVLALLSESILPQLADTPRDDILDSLFDGHATTDFVNKLQGG
jgi:hypothetical protein